MSALALATPVMKASTACLSWHQDAESRARPQYRVLFTGSGLDGMEEAMPELPK